MTSQLNGFIPYTQEIKALITFVTSSSALHAQWLNTLSYLENCGARKIAACEHPTKVKQEMLKHAAEEFRHAYHLKLQIKKVTNKPLQDYSRGALLGGIHTAQYLSKLDLEICRFLKNQYHLSNNQIKEIAYLLVTYSIEKRASLLYPLYQEALVSQKSNISMRAIIADEDHHLADMENELANISHNNSLMKIALTIESKIFYQWLQSMELLHQ